MEMDAGVSYWSWVAGSQSLLHRGAIYRSLASFELFTAAICSVCGGQLWLSPLELCMCVSHRECKYIWHIFTSNIQIITMFIVTVMQDVKANPSMWQPTWINLILILKCTQTRNRIIFLFQIYLKLHYGSLYFLKYINKTVESYCHCYNSFK